MAIREESDEDGADVGIKQGGEEAYKLHGAPL